MKPLYIFDIDGTLALIGHRRHLVNGPKPNWSAFFKACVEDTPNWPVIWTMASLRQAGAEIWFFSGRSDEVRAETEIWLRGYCGSTIQEMQTSLTMRRAGDYTADDVLKKQWLDGMLEVDRQRLVAVFDDRDRVVKMWRDAGVACFQVAPGEF